MNMNVCSQKGIRGRIQGKPRTRSARPKAPCPESGAIGASLRRLPHLLAVLSLALAGTACAENAPIPFSEIGAKATADYQGEALAVTATAEGARLRCGFQKLEGWATTEGLWLESTAPGGGKLLLVARAVGRERAAEDWAESPMNLPGAGMARQPLGVRWARGEGTHRFGSGQPQTNQRGASPVPRSTLRRVVPPPQC